MHIQGSFLGTGPNGNISLAVSIANLQINMGYSCIPYMKLNRLTHAAEYIADQMDVSVPPTMPYVGAAGLFRGDSRDSQFPFGEYGASGGGR